MKSFKTRIFLPFLIFLSSCTTILFVDQPYPPEIELGTEGQKIIIQNLFDYTLPEYVKEKHTKIYKATGEAFSSSLAKYLSNSTLVYAEVGDSLVKSEEGRILSDVLDPEYVEFTCEYFKADMLLAIDSVKLEFDFDVEGEAIIFGGEGVVKHFYLLYFPYLSLYDRDGTLLDRRFLEMVYFYGSRQSITAFITIKPSLTNALDEAIMLGADAGIEYGAKFFSTTATIPFTVYKGKPFDISYRLMLGNQWADAIRNLLPLTELSNRKTAKRAANNLWVAYLGFGDESSAEIWRKKSQQY